MGLGGWRLWGGREGGAGAHRVGELQLPSLLLEHDVQPAALEVRAVGRTGDLGEGAGQAERISCGGGGAPDPFPPGTLPPWGAHLAKAAAAWHPGLDIELAVGGKAQFLGGHVQDAVVGEKVMVKVSGGEVEARGGGEGDTRTWQQRGRQKRRGWRGGWGGEGMGHSQHPRFLTGRRVPEEKAHIPSPLWKPVTDRAGGAWGCLQVPPEREGVFPLCSGGRGAAWGEVQMGQHRDGSHKREGAWASTPARPLLLRLLSPSYGPTWDFTD